MSKETRAPNFLDPLPVDRAGDSCNLAGRGGGARAKPYYNNLVLAGYNTSVKFLTFIRGGGGGGGGHFLVDQTHQTPNARVHVVCKSIALVTGQALLILQTRRLPESLLAHPFHCQPLWPNPFERRRFPANYWMSRRGKLVTQRGGSSGGGGGAAE